MEGPTFERHLKVKAATKIYQGGLVVIDAGYAKPGATATGLITAGVAMETVDNTSGGNGDLSCKVWAGVFQFNNAGGGDAITQAEVGTVCYVTDDNNLMKTATGKSKAGEVIQVDSDGVWAALGAQAIGL
jgi:hypothetical protein